MGVFLLLFWYLAVFRWSYFAFRSAKFPIRDATGIGPQAFDLACPSHDRRPAATEKSTNFPSQREKPGMGRGGVVHRSAVT